MVTENLSFLKQNYPELVKKLENRWDNQQETSCSTIESRKGKPTIQITLDERHMLVHSKYDPEREAEQLIDQININIDNYEHVLFYGVGLGYHVKEFLKRHPNFNFSIYEPSIDIFHLFINEASLKELPLQKLKNIFVENSNEEGKLFLEQLTHNIRERILLIVLPSYQQIFKEKFVLFSENFKAAVSSKRQTLYVDSAFSTRWTLNSLVNLPKTVQTPNILSDEFKLRFRNKPLIIVSAGPSLEDEYESLRYIKEKKLAYIFAVGSANRALIAQNIIPDAVCTYDPQGHNHQVFASMIEQGIADVPMIYGTSVGYETLEMYQGPRLHMITSQDTVAKYYLRNSNGGEMDVVQDAPTIAAVTFQLGAKLGFNLIAFVGQNLAFRNEQYYSKDVEYQQRNRSIKVEEEDRKEFLLIDDVYGNSIETNSSFNSMREFLENQISQYPNIEVINTTKGGAAIQGTCFKPLEKLIDGELNKEVVDENWYLGAENKYDYGYILECSKKIEGSIDRFRKNYKEIRSTLVEMQASVENKKTDKLTKIIEKFNKLMKKFIGNEIYSCFIQPIHRTQFQALTIKAANIRKLTSEIERAKLIIEGYFPYLKQCKQTFECVSANIYRVHWELLNKVEMPLSKFYSSDCGAFHYVGEWEKQNPTAGYSVDYSMKQMHGSNNASVSFRLKGTSLRILGSIRRGSSRQIEITIDGNTEKISVRNSALHNFEMANFKQVLFEKHHLKNEEHLIEIKVLDKGNFVFSGIETASDSRISHIHEVSKMEELEPGKRIRCHYKATYNKVGEFLGLGEETKEFIPPESSAFPDGDFYFIMVDEVAGKKKLIADRNIQNNISWNELYKAKIARTEGLSIFEKSYNPFSIQVKLMTGGTSPKDNNNDWDKYIEGGVQSINIKQKDELIWNAGKKKYGYRIASWTESIPIDFSNRRVRRTLEGENRFAINENSRMDKNVVSSGLRPILLIQ